MIATAETPVTVTALEGLLSCVLARMSGQFVTSGKLPGAAFPLANVWLLSCVRASVCLEICASYKRVLILVLECLNENTMYTSTVRFL